MNIWVIADTHFYHDNIKKYQGRPETFNEQIIKNWNKLVQWNDLVIHLGDVLFGLNKEQTLPSLMAKLPGKKILCRGNHDLYSDIWYMERGFDFACDYFVSDDIAFSHAPLTPLPNQTLKNHQTPVRINIHGHFHKGSHRVESKTEQKPFKDAYYDSAYYQANKEKYVLVQIEDSLSPIVLADVIKPHLEKQSRRRNLWGDTIPA